MGNACCCNDGYAYKQRRQELLERRPPPPTEWPSGEVNLFRLGAAGHPCIEERYDFRRDRVGQSLGLGIVRRVFSWNADDGGAAYWCKTIPLSDLEPPELVENVRVEMFMMATLPRHPALPRLREVYKDDAAVHLVMDCDDAAAGGATLLSDSGVMPEVEAARVGRAVVDVLRVLHEAGVVLRDVKPANFILLSGQQLQVMLLDFCCATRFISGPGKI